VDRAHGSYCRLEYDDAHVAWLYLDFPGATNTLSLPALRDLAAALDVVDERRDLKGLVVLSARDDGFAAAPDIDEMKSLDDREHVRQYIECGQSAANRIAAFAVPTVALIHGPCLGSGLELALACRYRVAATDAALGFPDVRLGLHPCHGGTARLPALVGAWRALDMLRRGGSMNGAAALKCGLVDVAASGEALKDTARDLIERGPAPRRPPAWDLGFRLRLVRWLLYKLIDYEIQRKPCPKKYFATYSILKLWRDHGGRRMPDRLRAERESLLALIELPVSRNLVRTYLLQHRLQQEARDLDVAVPHRVHVFGAGTIGAGVAALLALHRCRVTLHDTDESKLQESEARARRLSEQRTGDPDRLADALDRAHAGDGGLDIDDADVVIEAIDEDLEAKQALIRDIEARVAPETMIATTTTTLSIDALGRGLARPERLVGLHFFDRIEDQPLVEVAAGEQSAAGTVAAGRALVTAAQKLPLPVRATPGFLVMRLQLPYMLAGAAMYKRPYREMIDAAGLKFGMPHGPLELADAVGLDVCQRLAEDLGHTVPEALSQRVEAGQLGKRTGKGFHNWTQGRRITSIIPPGKHPVDQITRDLIEPVVEEARRCLEQHVAADADLVDVGALFGVGFPAHTGGPLKLRQSGDGETTG